MKDNYARTRSVQQLLQLLMLITPALNQVSLPLGVMDQWKSRVIHSVTVTQFRCSISMLYGFSRHLVGKSLINVPCCDIT